MNRMFLVFVVLVILTAILHFRLFRLETRLKNFFKGTKAKDLEDVLEEIIQRLKLDGSRIKDLEKDLSSLEKIAKSSIHKVGFLRYNPFSDVGGDQSFSLALLDAEDNGIVITSFYSKEISRIYAKPIKAGGSDYPLTEEEREAIRRATPP